MKTQIVLYLYDLLREGGEVNRLDFCKDHFISERTFYRYVAEISKHLKENGSKYFLYEEEGSGTYTLKTK
ncbi:MAG: helix-turn-helix domain-containing protein [Clostridia bacterium]|nr:helix-turn-helix domain-containing protein [Clostridia bacterium]